MTAIALYNAMQKLILFLVLAPFAVAVTPQGFVLSPPNTLATTNLSTAAPFYSLASWQLVARVHDCTSSGMIVQNDDFTLSTDCSGVGYGSWRDNSQQVYTHIPAGATDFVVKIRRDSSTQSITIEMWRTDTGEYAVNSVSLGSNWYSGGQPYFPGRYFNIGSSSNSAGVKVDYVRLFSKIDPLGTIPSPNPNGDLGDWELDGNGADSSGYGENLTFPGPTAFVNTILYPPVVGFSPAQPEVRSLVVSPTDSVGCFVSTSYSPHFCTVVSGQTAILRSTAYSPNLNDNLKYSWTQTGGPAVLGITDASSPNTTLSNLNQFGEYDLQLTVSDNEGNSSSGTIEVGVVTVDPDKPCLIADVPQQIAYITGPLTPWGSGRCDPWPWYDMAEAANAIELQSAFSLPTSGQTPNPGTITLNNAQIQYGVTLTGNGTHFTTDCAGMPSNLAPNAPSCANAFIFVWWNAEDGPGSGRSIQQIQSVTDDTHATLNSGLKYFPPPPYSGLQYSIIDVNEFYTPFALAANGLGGSYNWNYYDNVVAFYRLYYRTGVTLFLNQARALADAWYLYALDHGYSNIAYSVSPDVGVPRLKGLAGIMIRALDGHPEYWPAIETMTTAFGTGTPPPGDFDPRETGYITSYDALAARLDPNASSRAAYCTSVSNAIQYFWAPQQMSNGGFWTNNYAVNQNLPSVGQGSEPWILSVAAKAFEDAYGVLNDPSACNNQPVANQSLAMTGRLLSFIYNYGGGGIRSIPPSNGGGQGIQGLFYMVGYTASGENPITGAGSISGTAGQSTITGNGTNFTAQFHCNSTDYIAINAVNELHLVTSCQGPSSLTLADHIGSSFSGSSYLESPIDASTDCGPSLSSVCFGGASPDLSTIATANYGWYYAMTGDVQYQIWGDDLFSGAFGGPAGGPGSTGPAVGPGASGSTTGAYGYLSALPTCGTSSPPCGGLGGPIGNRWGRDFGVGSGYVGAADNYLGYRASTSCSACIVIQELQNNVVPQKMK